jgi:hypothetical protein
MRNEPINSIRLSTWLPALILTAATTTYLLRNSRKTERGAKQFLTRLAVRVAPFASEEMATDGGKDIRFAYISFFRFSVV